MKPRKCLRRSRAEDAAAADAAVFTAFLGQVLLPRLREARPDTVLAMDNLAAHKTPAVWAVLDASGLAYRYLPPYGPELNPIEPSWAKLRQVAARTAAALHKRSGRHSAPSRHRTPKASSGTQDTGPPDLRENCSRCSTLGVVTH